VRPAVRDASLDERREEVGAAYALNREARATTEPDERHAVWLHEPSRERVA
jgi:hypothetical protein